MHGNAESQKRPSQFSVLRRFPCLVLGMVAFAAPVSAQDDTHWGVAGSFVPRWEFIHFLEDSMEREVDMRGDDVRVGIVRGRQLGGEWGASFVRRRIEDDSIVVQQESVKCVARTALPDVCARGTFHRTQGASITGAQFHRFFPIGTIARRVQLGAVLTGGVARLRGDAEEVKEHLQVTRNPATGLTSVSVTDETVTVEARHIFDDTVKNLTGNRQPGTAPSRPDIHLFVRVRVARLLPLVFHAGADLLHGSQRGEDGKTCRHASLYRSGHLIDRVRDALTCGLHRLLDALHPIGD